MPLSVCRRQTEARLLEMERRYIEQNTKLKRDYEQKVADLQRASEVCTGMI